MGGHQRQHAFDGAHHRRSGRRRRSPRRPRGGVACAAAASPLFPPVVRACSHDAARSNARTSFAPCAGSGSPPARTSVRVPVRPVRGVVKVLQGKARGGHETRHKQVQGVGFRVWSFGVGILGFRAKVSFRFRISDLGVGT